MALEHDKMKVQVQLIVEPDKALFKAWQKMLHQWLLALRPGQGPEASETQGMISRAAERIPTSTHFNKEVLMPKLVGPEAK